MKNFKKKKVDPGNYPGPEQCILEMVNTQLKVMDIDKLKVDSQNHS
jgi:hypothetical protein